MKQSKEVNVNHAARVLGARGGAAGAGKPKPWRRVARRCVCGRYAPKPGNVCKCGEVAK